MADSSSQPRQTQATPSTLDQSIPPSTAGQADVDADLEMEDDTTRDPQAQHTQDTSSSTLDHEPTTQTDTQPQQPEQQPNSTSHGPPPSRKDASLREFLSKMDDYAPIIPDAVTSHYLTVSGLPPPNPSDPTGTSTNSTPLPLARLLALATQKFIADIAADAYQYSRIRASNTASSSSANPILPGGAAPGITAGGGVGGADKAGGKGGGGGGGQGGAQLGVARSGYGGGGMGAVAREDRS
ncbi:hypothetical protein GJ744_003702 [Endocarpon pusillum]|uniref:Transcription initiation factor TFIID subunit 10 n=1 Tax=Endocarpon pusillum TaxID=364733 RepID=A0A8H7E0F4_9EURO|nr:hypothetical protein GJ744_003702 [Endocarpon pusillum]